MDNLLGIIDDSKQEIPDGLYLNLMNEIKKLHQETETFTVLVKKYSYFMINKRIDECFILDFEERLHNCKLLKLNKNKFDYILDQLKKNLVVHVDVYEYLDLEVELIKLFINEEEEEFEYFECSSPIYYNPPSKRYEFMLI